MFKRRKKLFKEWDNAMVEFIRNNRSTFDLLSLMGQLEKKGEYYYYADTNGTYRAKLKNRFAKEGINDREIHARSLRTQKLAKLFFSRLNYAVNTSIDACLGKKEDRAYLVQFEKSVVDRFEFKLHRRFYDYVPDPTDEPIDLSDCVEPYDVVFIADKPNK